MSAGKKLVLAVSLVASGVSTAFFFRKDAPPITPRQEAQEDFTFRDRVERRVASDAAWAKSLAVKRNGLTRPSAQQVPLGPAAAIPETAGPGFDRQTPVERGQNPVGALLPPVEARLAACPPNSGIDDPAPDEPILHRVVDGDTLRQIAAMYLGSGDRYVEVFALNRDVLANPDLLPIGTLLKIPGSIPIAPSLSPEGVIPTEEERPPTLQTVPKRHDAPQP